MGLANSLGCKLIPPNPNQDRAPPIFLPTIKTATRRVSVNMYCSTDVRMKNSLSILRIKNPKNEQIKIHINCFPPFPPQSNHSAISRFEVALTTLSNPKNIRTPTRITKDQSMFLYMDDSLGVMAETLRSYPRAVYLKPYLSDIFRQAGLQLAQPIHLQNLHIPHTHLMRSSDCPAVQKQ